LLQYEIDTLLSDLTDMRGADVATRAYLASRDAIDKLARLAQRLPDHTGFERKKSLYLAARKRHRKVLRKEWEMRRAIGIEVDWLDESDIAERFSFRRPAALLSHDAAQVDAYAITHALLRDASRRGLRVFDRTDVATIDATNDGVTLKTADGCIVRADRLVFATGYETHEFLDRKVARLISTYAAASEPLTSLTGWGEEECLIWEHSRPYLYLRTTADNRVILGGEDEDFRNPVRRDRLIGKKSERLASRFRELFPDIAMDIAFAWAGTFGETEDGLAYVGEQEDWPSCYFALGYGGNGITFSLLAAEIIRDALLGRVNENADLFRFDR
jgi:glycine/D-amino acid oxidase-like deaminating enzyme